jgi:hypothetical protein
MPSSRRNIWMLAAAALGMGLCFLGLATRNPPLVFLVVLSAIGMAFVLLGLRLRHEPLGRAREGFAVVTEALAVGGGERGEIILSPESLLAGIKLFLASRGPALVEEIRAGGAGLLDSSASVLDWKNGVPYPGVEIGGSIPLVVIIRNRSTFPVTVTARLVGQKVGALAAAEGPSNEGPSDEGQDA